MKRPKIVGLIPARSGSKRVKDKNIKELNGIPLIAFTIVTAIKSTVFDKIICATDDKLYARIAKTYGAEVPLLRDKKISGDFSPDIEWIKWILDYLKSKNEIYDAYSILRPTSPFRSISAIKKAWELFCQDNNADSLRAVSKVQQHPAKMWTIQNSRMFPLFPFINNKAPWHSTQTAALPEVYAQNASLEISWTRIIYEQNTISGVSVMPFISEGFEGFDINSEEDFYIAKLIIEKGLVKLPQELIGDKIGR